jgi:ABC-type molybdenum transport system ATPase subunit/photorepair protein PhrA
MTPKLNDKTQIEIIDIAERLGMISEELHIYCQQMTRGTDYFCTTLSAIMHINEAIDRLEEL